MSLTPNIPTNYSLDVAFSSTTRSIPNNSNQPILAMGYGFSEQAPGGSWGEEGQGVLSVKAGSPFFFTAFDTAPGNGQTVTTFEVDFPDNNNPFVDQNNNPIGTPGSIVATGSAINSQNGQSAGCNVVGLYSMLGPYYVKALAADTIIECTVKVTLRNGQIFQVDPEIQVEGGGGDQPGGASY
jgi:hypothetical protein